MDKDAHCPEINFNCPYVPVIYLFELYEVHLAPAPSTVLYPGVFIQTTESMINHVQITRLGLYTSKIDIVCAQLSAVSLNATLVTVDREIFASMIYFL